MKILLKNDVWIVHSTDSGKHENKKTKAILWVSSGQIWFFARLSNAILEASHRHAQATPLNQWETNTAMPHWGNYLSIGKAALE